MSRLCGESPTLNLILDAVFHFVRCSDWTVSGAGKKKKVLRNGNTVSRKKKMCACLFACLFVQNSYFHTADGGNEWSEKNASVVVCRLKRTSCIGGKKRTQAGCIFSQAGPIYSFCSHSWHFDGFVCSRPTTHTHTHAHMRTHNCSDLKEIQCIMESANDFWKLGGNNTRL